MDSSTGAMMTIVQNKLKTLMNHRCCHRKNSPVHSTANDETSMQHWLNFDDSVGKIIDC